ncbi:hypothetical protein AHAT_16460 [Agarivorans sp. Toyoura001]|uniref:DUF1835 domain-containing protein n=1 Tax=Agarivorans sp. Toyoura001 TaxID=2283141 RepID=UPI0010EC215B|nr:DUF1835 domain-containing protein [Agarivorans sp. Toyoura001]GDY25756.1 hypothetical protein AHAT_16460 [Agarivorans sp. Toyoura001]
MQLHITNGDSVGDMLAESILLDGQVLCWRDVLHDGPIIAAEGETHLQARADFIYQTMLLDSPFPQTEMTKNQILESFQQRQQVLDKLDSFSEIVLWFEHDLYDQLQLAECLYHLAKLPSLIDKTQLICIGKHPDTSYFHGLGNLNIAQLEALYPQRSALTNAQLNLGKRVWLTIAEQSPHGITNLLNEDLKCLPFMEEALLRFGQEYPSSSTGLTLTQHYILQSLASPFAELPILLASFESSESSESEKLKARQVETTTPSAAERYQQVMANPDIGLGRLFVNVQTLEKATFLGDTWLCKDILYLANLQPAYLTIVNANSSRWDNHSSYKITDAGKQALAGKRTVPAEQIGEIWRGGVAINPANNWRWNDHKNCFEKIQIL